MSITAYRRNHYGNALGTIDNKTPNLSVVDRAMENTVVLECRPGHSNLTKRSTARPAYQLRDVATVVAPGNVGG